MQQLQDGHGSQILRPTWFEDETKAVWTRKYMEAKRGHVLLQMWNDPYEVTTEDILRAASAAARPSARLPDSHYARTMSLLHLLKQEHYHLGHQKNGRDL